MQEKTSLRGDMVMGVFWVVSGGAVLAHAMQMPVPRHLGATVLTSPGLVPGLLGAALIVLGAVLGIRAWRGRTILSTEEDVADPGQLSLALPMVAMVLMVGYAIALILRQPFLPWTIGFIALFVIVFNWPEATGPMRRARLILGALALGACTAFLVQFVFEDLFYVRLP